MKLLPAMSNRIASTARKTTIGECIILFVALPVFLLVSAALGSLPDCLWTNRDKVRQTKAVRIDLECGLNCLGKGSKPGTEII